MILLYSFVFRLDYLLLCDFSIDVLFALDIWDDVGGLSCLWTTSLWALLMPTFTDRELGLHRVKRRCFFYYPVCGLPPFAGSVGINSQIIISGPLHVALTSARTDSVAWRRGRACPSHPSTSSEAQLPTAAQRWPCSSQTRLSTAWGTCPPPWESCPPATGKQR